MSKEFRVREGQIQITEDNDVVGNEITLHLTIIPLLVVSKIYGLFPVQITRVKNSTKFV